MARKKTKSKSRPKSRKPKGHRAVYSYSDSPTSFSPIRPPQEDGGIGMGVWALIGISAVVAIGAAYVTRPRLP
jgi:hypothetical protein